MSRNNFNHDTTTDEVLEGIDLTGQRALVTGGSSGLGTETARALASKGAEVIIAARNMEKAEEVRAQIAQTTGNDNIHIETLELASLSAIRDFAARFLAKYDRLNLLINNAGVMACPESKTADGFEMQFGSNHLGHFYMTCLIMPALLNAAPARIVSLSSLGHRVSPVVFDDINFENRPYDRWVSYGQAKTANSLFAIGLEKRLAGRGIHAYAVHPGVIRTQLARHLSEEDLAALQSRIESGDTQQMKSVEAGAATTIYAATAPELEGKGGLYLEDCGIAEQIPDDDPTLPYGVRSFALDPAAAEKLWEVSEQMVGETFAF